MIDNKEQIKKNNFVMFPEKTCENDRFARKDIDWLKSDNRDPSDQQAASDIEKKPDQA